jgi:hypothetical protein
MMILTGRLDRLLRSVKLLVSMAPLALLLYPPCWQRQWSSIKAKSMEKPEC